MKALLLAAHGSTSEPNTNRRVRRLAQAVAAATGVPVGVGFHMGRPHFSGALDALRAAHQGLDSVTVVPLMTSSGYYCNTVLPRELARNRGGLTVKQSEPVGTAPGLPALVLARYRHLLRRRRLDANAALMLVGHGTSRHAHSRLATEQLASQLRKDISQVVAAFLDEDPGPAEALEALQSDVIVLPFLIGSGYHASVDLPARVNADRVVCDRSIGTDPGLTQLILEVARPWL